LDVGAVRGGEANGKVPGSIPNVRSLRVCEQDTLRLL
jgi:hypothetical protein